MTAATVVVVLAGGAGRRMGGGKPLRPYGRGTLVTHALSLARRWSAKVALAVRSPAQVAGLDAPLLLDDPRIEGPCAGLASALDFAASEGFERLLILPCDAPQLPEDLLARLEAALEQSSAQVAMAASRGRLHPTCSLWRSRCADALPAYLSTGASLRGFAAACGQVVVAWDPAGSGDPFANANTPEELSALDPGADGPA